MILSNGGATISRLLQKAARATRETFRLRARDWNDAIDVYSQSRPLIVKGDYRGGWRHPWNHQVRWNAEQKGFFVNVLAGFVRGTIGGEVEVNVPRETATQATLERVGEGDSKTVVAYLTDEPEFEVPIRLLRAIGPDGDPTGVNGSALESASITFEPVPEFFQALGVGDPPEQKVSLLGGVSNVASFLAQEGANVRRLLRAVEVVLTVDRPSLTAQWTTSNGIDGTIAQFDIVYNESNVRPNARLGFAREYVPDEPPSVTDRIDGGKSDLPYDRLHVATIYFLSPSGTRAGSPVDNTWQPFVRHRIFWNLNHTTNRLPAPPENSNLTAPAFLAGGVGTQLINSNLAVLNDAYDSALELLSARTVEGTFWTT